MFIIRLKTIN